MVDGLVLVGLVGNIAELGEIRHYSQSFTDWNTTS
jgi:hypothetical protein